MKIRHFIPSMGFVSMEEMVLECGETPYTGFCWECRLRSWDGECCISNIPTKRDDTCSFGEWSIVHRDKNAKYDYEVE